MNSCQGSADGLDRRELLQRSAALGLAVPGSAALTRGRGGGSGTLKLRLVNDLTNLDPAFFANTSVDEPIMSAICEGLVTYDPHATTFKVVKQLAESLTPSADGLSYHFTLKKGIQFHGGYGELTAEDVKFSYERLANLTKPKLNSPYAGDWIALREVRVKDKYSGTIVLKRRFAAMMHSTLPVTSGYVLSKKAVEQRGAKYATHPIGTGPYEFVSWTPKQNVKLKRFAGYRTGLIKPRWNEIVLLPIADDNAADIAVETGAVDFGQISLQSIDRFASNSKYRTGKRPSLGFIWIGMNVLDPKLSDINVRQAIRYAIDVPSMITAGFESHYARANAVIPREMGLGYWPDAPAYKRDVNKAKGYLQKAGVSSLDLTYSYTEEPGANQVAQIAQANLADIGIRLTLDKQDGGTYYELGKKLRKRQLFWGDYETEPDPSFSMVWFTRPQFDQWNWMYWGSKRFDNLQAAGLHELDERKRNSIYIQMQKVWDADVNAVWLAFSTHYYAFRKDIKPAITPHGRVLPHAFQ